ncbi:4612_t:CDS:1, partial [Acaulospora morrowiae]
RLPELIEELKPNLVSRIRLDKVSKQRCGNLDSTLHEIYETEWKIQLLKSGNVPEKPSKQSRGNNDVIQGDINMENEHRNDEEESSDYDSDFIDDSEVKYTEEELAEFRSVGIEFQIASLEPFHEKPNPVSLEPSSGKDHPASPEQEEDFPEKDIIVINSDSDTEMDSEDNKKERKFGHRENNLKGHEFNYVGRSYSHNENNFKNYEFNYLSKNYIGDSDDDDLGVTSEGKKIKETADVIELRKARTLLEENYSRRCEIQKRSARNEKGIIINLGHQEEEADIYIHEELAPKLKKHQVE